VLALRGGAELVALWGQLGSVIELVSGAALAGVGTGIAVLVAQAHQPAVLRQAVRIGLAVSAGAGLAVLPLGWFFPEYFAWLVLGVAVGWLSVVSGIFNGYWLGLRERGKMLALAAALALIPLAAAIAMPEGSILICVALAHATPALLLLFFIPSAGTATTGVGRYVLPGLSIGILSPASMLAARAILAGEMSWHDAGLLQALWRVTDWVASIAGGVLMLVFLPRLSAAAGTVRFGAELRRAMLLVALPSAAAYAMLFLIQRPVFGLLYDDTFAVSNASAAVFFAGSAVRIAAWVALVALYAERRAWAITVGELLSLPLFVALLLAWPGGLSLEAAGTAWLAAYLAYAAFNLAALPRTPRA
jgi:O-antigen/teichoic acid export membrane protein